MKTIVQNTKPDWLKFTLTLKKSEKMNEPDCLNQILLL